MVKQKKEKNKNNISKNKEKEKQIENNNNNLNNNLNEINSQKQTILDILNQKDLKTKPLPSSFYSEIKTFTKRKRQNSQNTSRTISVNQTIISNNKSISNTTSNNIVSINNNNSNNNNANNNNSNNNNSNEDYSKKIKSKIVLKDGKFSIEKKDIGLIFKQYNEEQNKNNIPLQILDNNKKITSLSFKNLKHTNKWNENETKLFYKALEIFGLDFSFLEIVLKNRSRFEIKNKYLKEEKNNPEKISKIINSKKNINKMYEILKIYKNNNDKNNNNFINNAIFNVYGNNNNKNENKNENNNENNFFWIIFFFF